MHDGSLWARRLASLSYLSPADEDILAALTFDSRHCTLDEEIVGHRDADHVLVIVEGLACRFRLLSDGRRQILSFLFAGDMTSPERLLVRNPGQSIALLVPSQVAFLSRAAVDGLRDRPNICTAFGRYALVRESIACEWQVNVGLRTAQERVSHLICEIHARLGSIGMARGQSFRLPLTQLQLAESVALSAVHVNRTLMQLRRQKLLSISDRVITILDRERLCEIAGFDSAYLQFDAERSVRSTALSRDGGLSLS